MSGLIIHHDGQLDWQRMVPLAVLAACVGLLGSAYIAEFGWGYEPCVLCLYQRVPYAIAGVLAIAALSMPRGAKRRGLIAICVPMFLIGSGLAFYHVGVEQHWWASAAGCGGTLPLDLNATDLQAALMAPPDPACDEPIWTMFGVSIATYNVAVSLGLAVVTYYGWVRMKGRTR